MRRAALTLACFLSVCVSASAQKWDLQKVVEYAMANNLNVRLSDVQQKVAAVNLQQARNSRFPNTNASLSSSVNSGSNQDPTTFQRITQTYLASGLQLQSSGDIFNFYSKRNTIAASDWELKAAGAATDKIRYDIALSAANAYLNILLSKEQEKIAAVQIAQTRDQLNNTRKLVDAGTLPELNATQLEAQLAVDSLSYYTAIGSTELAILTLKTFMNIDAAAAFEVDTPPVELIPVEPLSSLQPAYVYEMALKNMPQQRFNDFKLNAAEKNLAAAKGARYPTLSGFGSLGTNFNNQSRVITGFNQTTVSSIGVVSVNGQNFDVVAPRYDPVYKNSSLTDQIGDNFRQSVGLSINMPIFSGGALKANYERSKLNINTIQLQKEADDQKLKQDIYQAYNAAVTAFQKFNTAKRSVQISELNYTYASKRFDAGILGTFDLVTTQNNLLRAKLELAANSFDYIFKMKVLEFYKGMGLKMR